MKPDFKACALAAGFAELEEREYCEEWEYCDDEDYQNHAGLIDLGVFSVPADPAEFACNKGYQLHPRTRRRLQKADKKHGVADR